MKSILGTICREHSIELTYSEAKGYLLTLQNDQCDDFPFEIEGMEFRIIYDDELDKIWEQSLIEQIKECYDLSDIPKFVSIDWEQTAKNCMVDGAGHHFSHYDGSELDSINHTIFRTN